MRSSSTIGLRERSIASARLAHVERLRQTRRHRREALDGLDGGRDANRQASVVVRTRPTPHPCPAFLPPYDEHAHDPTAAPFPLILLRRDPACTHPPPNSRSRSRHRNRPYAPTRRRPLHLPHVAPPDHVEEGVQREAVDPFLVQSLTACGISGVGGSGRVFRSGRTLQEGTGRTERVGGHGVDLSPVAPWGAGRDGAGRRGCEPAGDVEAERPRAARHASRLRWRRARGRVRPTRVPGSGPPSPVGRQ